MAQQSSNNSSPGVAVISTVLITLAVLIVAFLAYIYSGAYNVAADEPDGALVHWVVTTARMRSIESRAEQVSVPEDLGTPAQVQQGAQLFRRRCAGCHGAPDRERPGGQGFYPTPPQFVEHRHAPEPAEVYWVIGHGIKMTAMPRFGTSLDEDQMWALTAFVQKLPGMSAQEYTSLSATEEAPAEAPPDSAHTH